MPTSLIIGSGPAAAGVAMALSNRRDQQITVIDVGGVLEPERQDAVNLLETLPPEKWPVVQADAIRQQPVMRSTNSLPEKRTYGSDYPFRDFGQLQGLTADGPTNNAVVSGAYGGFSNAWGAQVMPLSAATFDQWPFSRADLEPHYRAVLSQIPFAGEEDDLAELFPLLATPTPLPPVSPRTTMVLEAYAHHRERLRRQGMTLGHARLAISAGQCIRCGLCMTGCPYSLIYSAAQTFDQLRRTNRIDYHGGLVAYRVEEDANGAVVVARETGSGRHRRFRADRIFVACGALGTTRLVLGSLAAFDREVTLGESVQFVLPALSRRAIPDPREMPEFTLNQFNMVIALDDQGLDLSQVHFYPYNPAYLDALPSILRGRFGTRLSVQLLRRLSVGLGYLPSWASPRLRVRTTRAARDSLPNLHLSQVAGPHRPPMLRQVLLRIWRAAPFLDLWPVTPGLIVSAAAKSYHFGGSFPHDHAGRGSNATTDRLGRLPEWKRIHLVDGSVLPTVAATTFTLTVMANAHRIAEGSLALQND